MLLRAACGRGGTDAQEFENKPNIYALYSEQFERPDTPSEYVLFAPDLYVIERPAPVEAGMTFTIPESDTFSRFYMDTLMRQFTQTRVLVHENVPVFQSVHGKPVTVIKDVAGFSGTPRKHAKKDKKEEKDKDKDKKEKKDDKKDKKDEKKEKSKRKEKDTPRKAVPAAVYDDVKAVDISTCSGRRGFNPNYFDFINPNYGQVRKRDSVIPPMQEMYRTYVLTYVLSGDGEQLFSTLALYNNTKHCKMTSDFHVSQVASFDGNNNAVCVRLWQREVEKDEIWAVVKYFKYPDVEIEAVKDLYDKNRYVFYHK